ncbi:MAG: SCO family protein [Steroidobacteraceae bacterium]
MLSRRTVLWVLAAASGGVVAATLLTPASIEIRSGTPLPRPRPVAAFELIDQHGHALTREVFAGRWSLVFTGFTSCPDICPTTLALLAALAERLRQRGGDLQTLFVSVDPERDTPEVLAPYVGHFDERMIGVTGTQARIDGFCEGLGLAHVRNPGPGGAYTVDHSAALVLIDPRARVVAYFQPPYELGALVADLSPLVGRAR